MDSHMVMGEDLQEVFDDSLDKIRKRESKVVQHLEKLKQEIVDATREMEKAREEADWTREKVDSLKLKEVEDLRISDYLVEEPTGTEMTFQELLIFAAKKEQKAVELYSSLKERAGSDELKKLFDFLINQEKSHKLKLEKEYEKYVLGED